MQLINEARGISFNSFKARLNPLFEASEKITDEAWRLMFADYNNEKNKTQNNTESDFSPENWIHHFVQDRWKWLNWGH